MSTDRRKYRKTAVVDAEEITAELLDRIEAEYPEWFAWRDAQHIAVHTKRDIQVGCVGDFLIFNPDGECYPCPRDTFLSTYEGIGAHATLLAPTLSWPRDPNAAESGIVDPLDLGADGDLHYGIVDFYPPLVPKAFRIRLLVPAESLTEDELLRVLYEFQKEVSDFVLKIRPMLAELRRRNET